MLESENKHPELVGITDELATVAQALLGSAEVQNAPTLTSQEVTPIIWPANDADRVKKLLKNVQENKVQIEFSAYNIGLKELVELRQFLQQQPELLLLVAKHTLGAYEVSEELRTELLDLISTRAVKKAATIDTQNLRLLLTKGFLISDLLVFYSQVLEVTGGLGASTKEDWTRAVADQAVYIEYPVEQKVRKLISHQGYRLLQMSRMIGLVPFRLLKEMQDKKIIAVGASAAAPTILSLVASLAEKILWIDDGIVDPAKSNMMKVGGVDVDGQHKSVALLQKAYRENPFGSFAGLVGRVFQDADKKRSGYQDLTFQEAIEYFGQPADLVIEVADSSVVKAQLRLFMQEHYPTTPLAWLADTDTPFAGLELPQAENYFNRNLPLPEIQRMAENPQEALRSVAIMVQEHFPVQHQLAFIQVLFGTLPFWSQTPQAAAKSSATLTDLIHRLFYSSSEGNAVFGKNITSSDAQAPFVPFDAQDSDSAVKLLTELLQLP